MARGTRNRFVALAIAACVGFAVAPARADSVTGAVLFPTMTSPGAARLLFAQTGANGLVGHVFRLNKLNGSFTMRALPGGLTGSEDFDIQFYSSIETGTTVGDPLCTEVATTCTKPIPAGARWAVVVMSLGLNGTFLYTS